MIQIAQKKQIKTHMQPIHSTTYRIDEEAVPHVTALLRNMYPNPTLAVVREYISNAVDAHVEHKVDKPILLHLPTFDEPWFSVRDYGPGLNKEDTERLLYGYGASGDFKRTSNDIIGGFGIGCKCGFAVADSFIYTIYHNNTKSIWLCFLDELDMGRANLLSAEPTTEPAGVEIKIPIKEVHGGITHSFQEALNQVVPYVQSDITFTLANTSTFTLPEPFTPLMSDSTICTVNGVDYEIKFHWTKNFASAYKLPYLKVGISVFEIDRNIQYELELSSDKLARLSLIEVPIGFLQLAPSREALQYSQHTKTLLKAIFQHLEDINIEERAFKLLANAVSANSIFDQLLLKCQLGMDIPPDTKDMYTGANLAVLPGVSVVTSGTTFEKTFATSKYLYTSQTALRKFHQTNTTSTLNNIINVVKHTTRTPVVLFGDYFTEPIKASDVDNIFGRMLTYVMQNPTTLPHCSYNFYVINAKREDIPWANDGSVHVIETLPEEIDTNLIVVNRPTRSSYSYTPAPGALNTRVMSLRSEARENHNGDGAYWDRVPTKDIPEGVKYYVPLNTMQIVLSNPHITAPPRTLSSLRNAFPNYLPKTIYGIREKDVKNLDKSFKPLLEYVAKDFATRDAETIVKNLWQHDTKLRSRNRKGNADPLLKIWNDVKPVQMNKLLRDWYELINTPLDPYASFLHELWFSCNYHLLYKDSNIVYFFDRLPLKPTGPLTRWLKRNPEQTLVDETRESASPLDKLLRNFITAHPLIATAFGLQYNKECAHRTPNYTRHKEAEILNIATYRYGSPTVEALHKLLTSNPKAAARLWQKV